MGPRVTRATELVCPRGGVLFLFSFFRPSDDVCRAESTQLLPFFRVCRLAGGSMEIGWIGYWRDFGCFLFVAGWDLMAGESVGKVGLFSVLFFFFFRRCIMYIQKNSNTKYMYCLFRFLHQRLKFSKLNFFDERSFPLYSLIYSYNLTLPAIVYNEENYCYFLGKLTQVTLFSKYLMA